MSGVRLRRLGAEMARLRQERNLTKDQVAAATGISVQSLWRLESAQSRVQKRTVVTLLTLYQAPEDVQQELLALHRTAKERGLLTSYAQDLPGEYPAYIEFESLATGLSTYQGQVVPGLLQTPDYARALVESTDPTATPDEVSKSVKARLERQELLHKDKPLRLWAILDEAVLRRRVGGLEVMARQVARLLDDARLPNVTLQVIPFEHGGHAGMRGRFVILDFADPDPSVVYLDHQGGDVFLDSKTDVARFKATFDQLRAAALSPAQSLNLLHDL